MAFDAFPLSANGKLDRKALPAFEDKTAEDTQPSTELEKTLVRIWEHVLQVSQVGVRDNFFELGGDSLVATHLVAEIRKVLGVDLTLDRLFQFPDIAHLAESLEITAQEADGPAISDAAALPAVEIREGERFEPFPLTDVQYTLLFSTFLSSLFLEALLCAALFLFNFQGSSVFQPLAAFFFLSLYHLLINCDIRVKLSRQSICTKILQSSCMVAIT